MPEPVQTPRDIAKALSENGAFLDILAEAIDKYWKNLGADHDNVSISIQIMSSGVTPVGIGVAADLFQLDDPAG